MLNTLPHAGVKRPFLSRSMGSSYHLPIKSAGSDVRTRLRRVRQVVGSWELLVADGATAATQMAIDEALVEAGRPIFRLFRWARPALSLGFKQPRSDWMDLAALSAHGVELVERPTGGGVAVHSSDLSYSVVIPSVPGLRLNELLRGVCESVTCAVRSFGVLAQWCDEVEHPAPHQVAESSRCGKMVRVLNTERFVFTSGATGQIGAGPRRIECCLIEESPYAIMVEERKLCGLAIRRYPTTWLIQGSLLVRPIPTVFERLMPTALYQAFQTRALALEAAVGRAIADDELIEILIRAWRRTWGVPCFWTPLKWPSG